MSSEQPSGNVESTFDLGGVGAPLVRLAHPPWLLGFAAVTRCCPTFSFLPGWLLPAGKAQGPLLTWPFLLLASALPACSCRESVPQPGGGSGFLQQGLLRNSLATQALPLLGSLCTCQHDPRPLWEVQIRLQRVAGHWQVSAWLRARSGARAGPPIGSQASSITTAPPTLRVLRGPRRLKPGAVLRGQCGLVAAVQACFLCLWLPAPLAALGRHQPQSIHFLRQAVEQTGTV